MNSLRLIIILVVFLFEGCVQKSNVNRIDISDIEVVNVVEQKEFADLVFPHRILKIDNYLFVENRNDTCFFEIYDVENLKRIIAFGKKGRGPNEFLMPSIYDYERRNGEVYLKIHDVLKRTLSIVSVNSIILGGGEVYNTVKLPNSLGIVERILYEDIEKILYTPDNDRVHARFCVYNKISKLNTKVEFVPKLAPEVSEINCYPIYNTTSSCYDDSLGLIAVTPSMLGQIDFFRLNGEHLYSSQIDIPSYIKKASKSQLIFRYGSELYHTDIKSTKNYVYMLYQKIKDDEPVGTTVIYKFNWSGVLKKKVEFSEVCVSFDIDEKRGCIYTVAYDNVNFKLKKFKLDEDI